ncbi:hypothetical protein BV924_22630 [Pectobacterium odoriferum]|uniref:Uncharacterized protein n=1 Tax=Pectobacterium odoriferum TaxID=78398 RepID=A0ABD6VIL7_9GAMM|nr:hypothetical protein BVY06_23520 [Pectobacterium odoriferum]POE07810.1 hypothetical protein BV924_22630 [Pectobacterium odoriferum]POE21946.1 hypothetical protein BV926_22685 [Pectobacterium odoriferum]POE26318.1 hypothetical protein BV919_22655 [Pectobacterium odoriferum]POE35463.1 hypothetical protein BV920_23415 [Pectobacterium odoriferum]
MAVIVYFAWLAMVIQTQLRLLRDLLAKKLMSGEVHIIQVKLWGSHERTADIMLFIRTPYP